MPIITFNPVANFGDHLLVFKLYKACVLYRKYFRSQSLLQKYSFSEKATKIGKNIPLVLTLQNKDSCFVKTGGFLWPFHNILTLKQQKLQKKKYEPLIIIAIVQCLPKTCPTLFLIKISLFFLEMGGKTQSKMCMVALQKQFDFSILNSTSPFFLSIHHFGMCLYPGYYHNAVYFCPLHKHKSTLNPLINCESINYNIFISTYDFVLFRLQQTN